jgi:hypothetical protein
MRKFYVGLLLVLPLLANAKKEEFKVKPEIPPALGAEVIETEMTRNTPVGPVAGLLSTNPNLLGLPLIPSSEPSIPLHTQEQPSPHVTGGGPVAVFSTLLQARNAGVDPLGETQKARTKPLASSAVKSAEPSMWPFFMEIKASLEIWGNQLLTLLHVPSIQLSKVVFPPLTLITFGMAVGTLVAGGVLALVALKLRRRASAS